MEKRYGLPTAICMVVGIVIGSGVFFKAEKVLQATKGNMPLGILAWGIVGAIMIFCSCSTVKSTPFHNDGLFLPMNIVYLLCF